MVEVQLVEKFCEQFDQSYLSTLSEESKDIIKQVSIYHIKKDGRNKNRAQRVLHMLGYDKSGKILPPLKSVSRKVAEDTLASFAVSLTGARPGDLLMGKSAASKGAVIRILKYPIYPKVISISKIIQFPDVWDRFIIKLGSLPFYVDMTPEQRSNWIKVNQDPVSNSIGEGSERIEFLQPGTSDFSKKLEPKDIEYLLTHKKAWKASEIESLFPGKPGSKARKSTLILHYGMWSLSNDYKIVDKHAGTTIDVTNGNISKGQSGNIFVLDDITKQYVKKAGKWIRPAGKGSVQDIGFIIVQKGLVMTDTVEKELFAHFGFTDKKQIFNVKNAMYCFTGAAYKSLLQKLIRFTPITVNISGKEYPTELVLIVTLCKLYRYPGSFVPDIQRYVTGIESLAKRLAVSIIEDSSPGDPQELVSMLGGALVAQRIKTWSPDKNMIINWFTQAIAAVNSKSAYKWDNNRGSSLKPYTISTSNTVLQNSSALLDELKSFQSDLGMLRDIAEKGDSVEFWEMPGYRPVSMPLIHCVDMHWLPNIVLFFSPETVKKTIPNSPPGKPFSSIQWKIFKQVTGINPRRTDFDYNAFITDPFVMETRVAQETILSAQRDTQQQRETTGETITFKHQLADGWLTALVGPIEVKGTPVVIVTMKAEDPLQLVPMRRPTRDMKDAQLTPERQESAISQAKEKLQKGIVIKTTLPGMNGATIILKKDESGYNVKIGKKIISWEKARNQSIECPIHPKISYTMRSALLNIGDGIQESAEEDFVQLLNETPGTTLRRAIMYLDTYSKTLEINRISRDGGGINHAVVFEDVPTFQFILKLSSLYPAALRPVTGHPGKFSVPVPPVLWTIVEKIRGKIAIKISKKISNGWKNVANNDKMDRNMWEHQIEALEEMKTQHSSGGKGNFIWIPVGMGKTLIVTKYLIWLREKSQLPKYILYTLPQSAIKSVVKELMAFGFDIDIMIPLKSVKGKTIPDNTNINQSCTPRPFVITMLEHDYLRRCEIELSEIAPECIFVIDEVHKALNDTKRTSVALEISHLSREFIAMTGTPVIDSNTYKLIWWLKQVVLFEVNEDNFWVAANSMIAKKVNTGVIVEHQQVLANFTGSNLDKYNNSVPPSLGGKNTSPSFEDWKYATELSYDACNDEIIVQVSKLLKEKRGVMLVAKDTKHQKVLEELLITKQVVKKKDIFLLESNDSIFLTDESVTNGETPDYKVVIVPIRKAEGYTLTRLSAMVSSVYPSNNATREQIEGRINRIGQKAKLIKYITVHTGILTRILQHHNDAKSLSLALQSIADEIKY